MIQEDYVSFETAKLLKEKGFEGYGIFSICDENAANAYIKKLQEKHLPYSSDDPKLKEFYYAKPTLQMAMKWLREVHHLVIQIELIDFLEHGEVWLYSIIERKTIKQLTSRDEDFTEHSYEQACEAAIKYCLENLI